MEQQVLEPRMQLLPIFFYAQEFRFQYALIEIVRYST